MADGHPRRVRLRRRSGREEAPVPATRACNAPFASLYLDPAGEVTACCQNRWHPLGNVAERSLLEIWRGPEAERLREHIDRGALDLGCELCAVEVDLGAADTAYLHHFDDVAPMAPHPDWPTQLELALSISCNLQCIMCNGELSSSIRTQREGRPALPRVYGDRFFEELDEFLPQLRRVKFLGGEPFLGAEPMRVMTRLVDLGLHPDVYVTTNGTQWNDRVERVVSSLAMDVSISVDAFRAETLEAIRIGVDHAALLRNVERFRAHSRASGLGFSLTFCLMRVNWQELGDVLAWGDELDVEVGVSTVTNPPHLSLATAPPEELADAVAAMAAQDRHWRARLGRNLPVWQDQLERLRQLAAQRAPASGDASEHQAVALSTAWADERGVHRVYADGSQLVRGVEPDARDVLGVDLGTLVGGPTSAIIERFSSALGTVSATSLRHYDSGLEEHDIRFDHHGRSTQLRAIVAPTAGDGHVWVLAARGRRRAAGRVGPVTAAVACRAPFTSMYLDQRGGVRACCQNDFHLLGNVADDRSLLEIWRGEEAQALRRAMEADDLGLGCDFCQWQVDEGRPDLAFSRWFDDLPFDGAEPAWPTQIEFSISNLCNLRCVMCSGEFSSAIRAREGLDPLPAVYGDRFFAELAEFLPHLESAKFLGGEPLLATETSRVMTMMVEAGLSTRCQVTTNGTQWTPRVERILDALPVDVTVSVDAATAATYEATRLGASWDLLQANLDRFCAHAEAHGTAVTLTFCLMTTNWHEFAAFCRMADARGVDCAVNTVTDPNELSLFHLPVPDLAGVVAALEDVERTEGDTFRRSRATWLGELDKLRRHLAVHRSGGQVTNVDVRRARRVTADPAQLERRRARAAALRVASVGPDAVRLEVDEAGVVVGCRPAGDVLGIPHERFLGRHQNELGDVFGAAGRQVAQVDQEHHGDGNQVAHIRLVDGTRFRVVSTPAILDDGTATGTWLDVGTPAGVAQASGVSS